MGICGAKPPAGSRGRPMVRHQKAPLKLETFELVDTQRRSKSAKFRTFWTRSSAQVEVDSTVFAIFCKIL